MRCLIVDDHKVISAGLRLLIKSEFPDCDVEFATTVKMAIQLLGKNQSPAIDIMMVDMVLPGESGFTLLQHVQSTELENPVKTLVISGLNDAPKIELCKSMGAHGYLSKIDAHDEVLDAMKVILSGGTYFGTADAPAQNGNGTFEQLPDRYRDILDLLMAGFANKRIAIDLELSYGTVKNYIHAMMKSLNVTSRTNMVLKAQQAGYLPRSPEEVISAKKLLG